MKFELPSYFAEAIQKDPEVAGTLNSALGSLYPWFEDNKLYFFPEFTDHGVNHINTVLAAAAELIGEEARSLLTSQDCAAIVGAILLHDCAMQLSWDGFQTLLSGEYVAESPLRDGGEQPWPQLFEAFMHEARRWDQSKLEEVFGTANIIVREIPRGLHDVNETDRRTVGEFIRRHHARLAHEIALIGVPGPLSMRSTWVRVFQNSSLPADLIGFIARSHNLNLREAKDRLPELRRREFSGIHAPFAMAVLRIADYLQIQSRRAHPSLLSIRSLHSCISIAEWRKHAALIDMHRQGDDPEAMVIHAEPKDVTTLFGLRKLFGEMQKELDETWATLGEVYGLLPKLEGLAFRGLSIRRLRTNLDDLGKLEREQNPAYVPVELKLRSAGADMLGLLVAPLYGSDPTIAIRELVQNAVDACAERYSYEASRQLIPEESRVSVRIEIDSDSHGFLEVQDNGIGMTLETVRDYFLVAGASFRRSVWWKEHFQTVDGHSTVRRSGRFGVGALASFLAGSSTVVTTRHVDDASGRGIQFAYSINDRHVQATRVRADIGTTIRVEITNPRIVDSLRSAKSPSSHYSDERIHWYGLSSPIVTLTFVESGRPEKVDKPFTAPSPEEELPSKWYSISHPDYKAIHWSFKRLRSHSSGYASSWLLCNGFLVSNDWDREIDLDISPLTPTIGLPTPTLSVFDPDGYLPLTLSRRGLASKQLPFSDQLKSSLAHWYLDEVLTCCSKDDFSLDDIDRIGSANRTDYGRTLSSATIWTSAGICLADPDIVRRTHIKRLLLVLESEAEEYKSYLQQYLKQTNSAVATLAPGVATKTDIERLFYSLLRSNSENMEWVKAIGSVDGIRIACSTRVFQIARERGRVPKYLFEPWTVHEEEQRRVTLTHREGKVPEEAADLPLNTAFMVELYLTMKSGPVNSAVSKAWDERSPQSLYLPLKVNNRVQ